MDSPGAIPTAWDPVRGPALPGNSTVKKLRRDRLGLVAVLLALFIIVIALVVPLLPLQDPLNPDYDRILEPPGADHPLGTDLHGRDQLSRTLWASRTSIFVGLVATGLALTGGLILGGFAGYGGRRTDGFLMRVTDVFLSFPVIIGAIAIMAITGPGTRNVFLAIAFFGWPVFARVFRSSVISTRKKNYVKAARVLGAGELRIFLRHILPNSITPVISYAALAIAGAILAEAGLSFINLGVQRPYPSWGLMLSESVGLIEQAPWLMAVPGVAITLTVLIFMLLGAASTRALDPRTATGGS